MNDQEKKVCPKTSYKTGLAEHSMCNEAMVNETAQVSSVEIEACSGNKAREFALLVCM
jgi:hypothetical protein